MSARACAHCASWCVRGTGRDVVVQCAVLIAQDRKRQGRRLPASGSYTVTVDGTSVQVRPVSKCRKVRTVPQPVRELVTATGANGNGKGRGVRVHKSHGGSRAGTPARGRVAQPSVRSIPRQPPAPTPDGSDQLRRALRALGLKEREAQRAAAAALDQAPGAPMDELVRLALATINQEWGR